MNGNGKRRLRADEVEALPPEARELLSMTAERVIAGTLSQERREEIDTWIIDSALTGKV